MPPRLNFLASCRSLALRPKAHVAAQWRIPPPPRALAFVRGFADETTTTTPLPMSSTQTSPPPPPPPPPRFAAEMEEASPSPPPREVADVSDAAVALSQLSASIPVDKAPEEAVPDMDNEEALRQLEMISYGLNPFDARAVGHKYGLPELPIPSEMTMKNRYHPVLVQLTNLLMRDGKKSKAQRDMAMILNFLRTMPAPNYSMVHRMMPDAPPASHLPLDPIAYVTLAIDSVAPLVKIRNFPGLGGGGTALPVPVPLSVRQRRRIAFMWIMSNVNSKTSRGSGRTMLAHRIAEEIAAIVEGKSALWDKRLQLHKAGTASRANVIELTRKRKR